MDPRRRLSLVVLAASVVLGLLMGVVAVVLATGPDRVPAAPAPPGIEPYALRVLRSWDRRRAEAYAHADGSALATLYVAGSRTGASDVALLREYRSRGLRVARMETQMLGVRVLRRADGRLTLLVTDALAGAVAAGGGERRWALPEDRPSTRRVVLVRDGGRWRVAETYVVD